MPSDSVASFLDQARASRLILPDQVDDLIRRTDVPQENLAAVCDRLRDRGVLTAYQADLIRAGRVDELSFAGYPVVGDLGPCPGGTAYRALHPSLRTPVVLRRIHPDWVGADLEAYVQRARAACPVVHPHLANLLDAGVYHDELYATLEPFDAADLHTLVADIGPMPAALAASYARQVALALQAVHARGLTHGGVRPETIRVGPLVPLPTPRPDGSPRSRPTPTATVKLFELGLVPLSGDEPTPADDVAGLGGTLHYLLTGRAPSADGPTLEAQRPDLPAELVTLIREMTAADPDLSAAAVAGRLARVASPAGPVVTPPPAAPDLDRAAGSDVPLGIVRTTGSSGLSSGTGTNVAPVEEPPTEDPPGEWVAEPYQGPTDSATPLFTPIPYGGWSADAASGFPEVLDDSPPPRQPRDEKSSRVWIWLTVGAGLQLLAIVGWIYLFATPGCTGGDR
jgi:serine/threonine protein kinase